MYNTSGFQVIPNVKNLERPFLLCLSARDNLSKFIYGMMREGAQAARLLTTQEVAAGFKLNEFPIDILGVRFQKDENYHQASIEIAENFLFPFLTQKGKDLLSILKQARKVNILAYCDGVNTYKDCEERLEYLLKKEGFNNEVVASILSHICLVALESDVETGGLCATSVAFLDINDKELKNKNAENYRKALDMQGKDSMYSFLGNTKSVLYIYNGSGIHNVKEYFEDSCIAKPVVSAVTSMFLEDSLDCQNNKDIYPVNVMEIMDRLEYFADETIPVDVRLRELDKNLSYDDAPRYTKENARMRMELDAVYKILRKTNDKFIRTLGQKQGLEIRLESVIRGVHEFSSHVTYEQVLTAANMWHPKEGRDILTLPSDKEVRGLDSKK